MEVRASTRLAVTDPSGVGEARRGVARLTALLGMDDEDAGRAALAATEAATNLLKHAGGGELVVRRLASDGVAGVEILALDRGPGIADLAEALRDGVSTAGTQGQGLGAIRRQADDFDVWSGPGRGAVLLARVWAGRAPPPACTVAAVQLPYPGEEVCGDGWASWCDEERTVVLVVDGLGHGAGAAEAAVAAVRVFDGGPPEAPALVLQRLHGVLRPTRGAAVAVAEIRPGAGTVRFAGVGNIGAAVVTPGAQRAMMSHNGIVGHEMRKVQELEYPWPAGARLVMHSDGLETRWEMARFPGLVARDPALAAALLYRDFNRGRDDVTVVVAAP
jgi:anti-sigma regulatory factor (Ser/Thr protein kinase)